MKDSHVYGNGNKDFELWYIDGFSGRILGILYGGIQISVVTENIPDSACLDEAKN